MKPKSDLCFKCRKHRESISNAHTEDEKLAATAAFTEHIQQSRKEREYYNNCIQVAKKQISTNNIQPDSNNSIDMTGVHYILDYSQWEILPYSSQQSGQIYFATPRKIVLVF